jgi:hypothetical protein
MWLQRCHPHAAGGKVQLWASGAAHHNETVRQIAPDWGHEVHERLARWLLMCADRVDSNSVPLTQEFLTQMLGTRRSSVTVAAGILQKAGLISHTGGEARILSR